MSTQPKALQLADMVERYNAGVHSQAIYEDYQQAAAELRRLHEVNADLLAAFQYAIKQVPELATVPGISDAIVKARGEQ